MPVPHVRTTARQASVNQIVPSRQPDVLAIRARVGDPGRKTAPPAQPTLSSLESRKSLCQKVRPIQTPAKTYRRLRSQLQQFPVHPRRTADVETQPSADPTPSVAATSRRYG